MANNKKWDVDNWYCYSYLPYQRIIYLGSHTPETSQQQESGTDCQMAEYFIKAIIHLNSISNDPIMVHMNNHGGDFQHGMAIYDAIRLSESHIYGVAWGYASSMGSIIFQACDSRIVTPSCTIMIHDGENSLCGSQRTVEAWALHGKILRIKMYEIYLSRMKTAKPHMTLKKIEAMCANDRIFSANEAIDYGLADWLMTSLNDPYEYYATNRSNTKWSPK